MVKSLTIRRPDDWHVHLRDGAMLRDTVSYTARQFARAIVMPNLTPPITTRAMACDYRARILEACPASLRFTPLMTAYLTEDCAIDDLIAGARERVFVAAKLYPAGATTNSAQGVREVARIYPVLEAMEREGLVLCVHGEVTDPRIDIFDREAVFIERHLAPIIARFPALRIVFEHITTREAVDFVEGAGENLAATITPHHLHINRNAIFDGGLRPHAYCLPVAKREAHRLALRRAATSGNPKFLLGTDSAPHLREAKESDCGCAGIFNAPHALESYLEVFEEEDALDRFEAFASLNGPNFYRLPLNEARITLVRAPVEVERVLRVSEGEIVPFHRGERLSWRLAS